MRKDTFEKAQEKIAAFNSGLSKVRNDPTLSDQGRRQKIADLYEQTRNDVDRIKRDGQTATVGDRNKLQRELFGFGDDLAGRDARQRVREARSATQLAEIMEAASISGDRSLERAGFQYAYERSVGGDVFADEWRLVVDEYREQNPHIGSTLDQLDSLTGGSKLDEAFGQLATVVRRPKELDTPAHDFPGRVTGVPAGEAGRPAA